MKLGQFFKPREKFLILEIAPSGTDGLFLSVDEDRKIIFEKLEKNIELKKFFKSPVRRVSQKTWEGETLFKSHRKVIAAADPALATTIPIPLELAREHASIGTKLTTPELENLIAQAMAKIFNGCRGEAANRLHLSDLDAVLVGAKAKYFKVDGKRVMNPAGFAGKKVSFLLELTFTGRELFEDLKPFFNAPDNFFFAEAPQARLFSFLRARGLPLSLITAGEGGAALYVLQKAKDDYAVLYREKLDWSFESLFKMIKEGLAVNEQTAKELYRSYHKGEMSASAERMFKKTLQPAIDKFFKEISRAKVAGEVYVDAPFVLPFALPHRHGKAVLSKHPMGEILGKLGFSIEIGETDDLLRPLSYFLEAFFDKSNSEINQKLHRRLHWLAV